MDVICNCGHNQCHGAARNFRVYNVTVWEITYLIVMLYYAIMANPIMICSLVLKCETKYTMTLTYILTNFMALAFLYTTGVVVAAYKPGENIFPKLWELILS